MAYFQEYQATFKLNQYSMKLICRVVVLQQSIGTAVVPIALKHLNFIIDPTFQIMPSYAPSLLSMRPCSKTTYISIENKINFTL